MAFLVMKIFKYSYLILSNVLVMKPSSVTQLLKILRLAVFYFYHDSKSNSISSQSKSKIENEILSNIFPALRTKHFQGFLRQSSREFLYELFRKFILDFFWKFFSEDRIEHFLRFLQNWFRNSSCGKTCRSSFGKFL